MGPVNSVDGFDCSSVCLAVISDFFLRLLYCTCSVLRTEYRVGCRVAGAEEDGQSAGGELHDDRLCNLPLSIFTTQVTSLNRRDSQ